MGNCGSYISYRFFKNFSRYFIGASGFGCIDILESFSTHSTLMLRLGLLAIVVGGAGGIGKVNTPLSKLTINRCLVITLFEWRIFYPECLRRVCLVRVPFWFPTVE